MPTKPRIMIVEDDAIVSQVVSYQLDQLGFEVAAVVHSGEECIQAAAAICPDLALMDFNLSGGMDGADAATRLRLDFEIPVIFVTAQSDAATLQRAKASEPYGFLVKPFDLRDLGIAVEMALFKHAAELERARLLAALQEALAKVKLLSGLLPICCGCKKVRDDEGYWSQVEVFIEKHTEARFSHGFCPACADKWLAECGGGEQPHVVI